MSDHQEIETTAIRLLSAREHTRKELLGKLSTLGFERESIEVVLDELAQRGLQSDARFTEQFTEARMRKGNGPLRIRAELRERGIDAGRIDQALEPYADEWQEQLRRVHDQKFGPALAKDRKQLAKRARFLEYRGFPADLIAQLLFRQS